MFYDYFDIGGSPLVIAADERGIRHIVFQEGTWPLRIGAAWIHRANANIDTCKAQLAAYLAGKLRHFNLPLAPLGTEFQQIVWRELRQIPFGETRSYSQIAAAIGRPRAVRAVGAANGQNPIAIVIPCHRVIGKSGTLTGYAGGLELKSRLLRLENTSVKSTLECRINGARNSKGRMGTSR